MSFRVRYLAQKTLVSTVCLQVAPPADIVFLASKFSFQSLFKHAAASDFRRLKAPQAGQSKVQRRMLSHVDRITTAGDTSNSMSVTSALSNLTNNLVRQRLSQTPGDLQICILVVAFFGSFSASPLYTLLCINTGISLIPLPHSNLRQISSACPLLFIAK